MEWKWVKNLLIILFLVLDCFLGWQVYRQNATSIVNSDTVASLESILASRNISCNFALGDIEAKKYMKKISISNEENIEEKFVAISEVNNKEAEYSGRNREILSVATIIASFVRDSKLEDVVIDSISLGYYPEINQIEKGVLSGEATPAWKICLEDGTEYIYNAYLGNMIKGN